MNLRTISVIAVLLLAAGFVYPAFSIEYLNEADGPNIVFSGVDDGVLTCESESGCEFYEVTGPEHFNLTINCMAESACTDMVVYGNSTGQLTINCGDYFEACRRMIVYEHVYDFNCNAAIGSRVCRNLDFYGGVTSFSCTDGGGGTSQCRDITFHDVDANGPANIDCNNDCDTMQINAGSGESFTSPVVIECESDADCSKMAIYSGGNPVAYFRPDFDPGADTSDVTLYCDAGTDTYDGVNWTGDGCFDPDTDGDLVGDSLDWDDDGDGVIDTVDAEPLNAGNTAELNLQLEGSNYGGSQLTSGQGGEIVIPVNYPYSGKLTYYGGNASGGACGYDIPLYYASTQFVDYYAAAGADVFDAGYNCGMVVEITNAERYNPSNTGCITAPNTTIRVMITDQCPECPNNHLDLAPIPMDTLAPGLAGTCGVLSADWRFVAAELTSNIQVQSKSGVSQYWYGFRFYGHNLPVTKVELKSNGSSTWYEADKSQGPSFYVLNGGYPLTLPLSIRFTDVNGSVLVATDVITSFISDAYFDTGVQLDGELTGDPL